MVGEAKQQLIPQNLLDTKKNFHSKKRFLYLLDLVDKKYGHVTFRLAGEGWKYSWQTLLVTILSAQSKDELTIIISEKLFEKYPTLEDLANANFEDVLKILKSMNYNRTKTKHIIESSRILLEKFKGIVPQTIDELITLPGVGRKTANLVISEEFEIPGICVDTHVHRMCTLFGFVTNTNDRDKTEMELKSFVPKEYWTPINRLFVLWGKECPSKDIEVLLELLLTKHSIYDTK
ncbi:MAG: endonuclease III [Nanoarchaeota archaeon]|nr:endonuclease III [Nanoarchaeota archaeon]